MPLAALTGLLWDLFRYCNLAATPFSATTSPLYAVADKGNPGCVRATSTKTTIAIAKNYQDDDDDDTDKQLQEVKPSVAVFNAMATPKHATHKSLLPSHEFYLAAGTVTVDRRARRALILRDRLTGLHGLPRGRADWGETLTMTAVRETFEEGGVRCTLLPVPVPTRATPPPGRNHRGVAVGAHGMLTPASSASSSASPSLSPCSPAALVSDDGRCGSPELLSPPISAATSEIMTHQNHFELSCHDDDDDDDDEVRDEAGEVTKGVLLTEPFALLTHFRTNGALAVVHWFVAEADSTLAFETGTQMADEDYEARWVRFDEAASLMPDANHADVVLRAFRLVDRLEVIERRAAAAAAAVST